MEMAAAARAPHLPKLWSLGETKRCEEEVSRQGKSQMAAAGSRWEMENNLHSPERQGLGPMAAWRDIPQPQEPKSCHRDGEEPAWGWRGSSTWSGLHGSPAHSSRLLQHLQLQQLPLLCCAHLLAAGLSLESLFPLESKVFNHEDL